ncbi:MAG TPA: MFS transporter [Thermoanaerobaculia bacterium]|nr:MFS transporter [Thermoanaerobaculia bacterium]
MSSRTQLFWAACAGIFVFGIVLALLGVLFGLPEMRERLAVNLAQQGDVFLALFFGVLLSTVISGPMIDSFGNKIVLTVSALLVTIALVMFSLASSFPAAALAALVLGFGGGGLNTSTNALVADLFTESRGAMLNVLGTFFGVGALFVPLTAAIITGILTIPQLLLAAAGLAATLTVAYLVMAFPPPRDVVGFSLLASIRAAGYPGVLLFGALLFCQSGNESSIGGWTSTYVGTLGASPRTATFILAGYWAALMAGRLIGAKLLERMTKSQLILASGIGSVIGCGMMLASTSIGMITVAAIVTGFSFAAVYPTTLAIAADRYERMAGTIFGFLFAVGLIGGMLFPWGIGHLSQREGVRAGMILPLLGAIAITVIATVIHKRSAAKVALVLLVAVNLEAQEPPARTILAIGAHAGDMELTCGALLAKESRRGGRVVLLHLTLGERGNPSLNPEAYAEQKRKEAAAVAAALGSEVIFGPYRDGELPNDEEARRYVAGIIRQVRPTHVVTHWRNSMHKDHSTASAVANDAVLLAALEGVAIEQPVWRGVRSVWFAENWEDREGFEPYIYVDVSSTVQQWRDAVAKYAFTSGPSFQYLDYYTALFALRGAEARRKAAVAFDVSPYGKRRVLDDVP